MLWNEFNRSDEVARAAARFEVEVHRQLVQRRIDEGQSEDEAGDVQRVFRADEFNATYRQLLLLRMERALLRDLGLQDYEADIMRERIKTIFGPKVTATKRVNVSDQLHIGNASTQQVQQLKQRGRRRGS